jgi:hypothetical protein
MDWNTEGTLHRRKPGEPEDRVTTMGRMEDLVRQYEALPEMVKDQYFIMDGGMRYDRHDIAGMARELSSQPPDA